MKTIRYFFICSLPMIVGILSLVFSFGTLAGTLGVFTSDKNGFDTHTFYYDDGKEVVIIDTQFVPKLTQAMVNQIKKNTASPITRVIITHPNPDKFNGLQYLHSLGATSISSRHVADDLPKVHAYKKTFWTETMKAFQPETYPSFEPIQEQFEEKRVITLASGETLSLYALKNAGVAAHQVVVRVDETGDLIVGDLVHHKAHAWLEGGLVGEKPRPNIDSWNLALDELIQISKGYPKAKAFGGRGEFVSVPEAVHAQQAYLLKVRSIVAKYVTALGNRRVELAIPSKAQQHHNILADKIAKAFPSYKLPYMVNYSVYGLVQEEVGKLLK